MLNKKLVISILAVGALILSGSLNAYFIRSEAGGYVLWNAKEAYFFIGRDTRGRHVKWIAYPLMIAQEMLGDIEAPDDDRGSMVILHVTPSGVERHVLELVDRKPGTGPSMFTPLEGRIWANYPTLGGLCWWAGDHFERATQEELQRLDGINHLANNMFRGQNDWSEDSVAGRSYTIKVGEEFELLLDASEGHGAVSIDMRKQGGEPTKVFNLDTHVGRVSGTEYRNAFHDRE